MNRLTKAFRESGYEVNRRNVEVMTRAMLDHVNIEEPEGLGDYLHGDVVSYNALSNTYKPRADAQMVPLNKSIGKYLEQPTLHYTIGTQLTKPMVDSLRKFGVESVMTHHNPVGFNPDMVSLTKVPSYGKDWMARLGSSYLESRLLSDVHTGAQSNLHGLHPLPAVAKGTELGDQKKKDGFNF